MNTMETRTESYGYYSNECSLHFVNNVTVGILDPDILVVSRQIIFDPNASVIVIRKVIKRA